MFSAKAEGELKAHRHSVHRYWLLIAVKSIVQISFNWQKSFSCASMVPQGLDNTYLNTSPFFGIARCNWMIYTCEWGHYYCSWGVSHLNIIFSVIKWSDGTRTLLVSKYTSRQSVMTDKSVFSSVTNVMSSRNTTPTWRRGNNCLWPPSVTAVQRSKKR